jgi:CRISPR-associated protein Cas2
MSEYNPVEKPFLDQLSRLGYSARRWRGVWVFHAPRHQQATERMSSVLGGKAATANRHTDTALAVQANFAWRRPMGLVAIVTNDVADRFRGFLASVMLEIAPTVYISPRMTAGVRLRAWEVLSKWHHAEPGGSIVMVWRDVNETGGVGIATLGTPLRELIEVDGLWLARRAL